jgi:hypothetical protein
MFSFEIIKVRLLASTSVSACNRTEAPNNRCIHLQASVPCRCSSSCHSTLQPKQRKSTTTAHLVHFTGAQHSRKSPRTQPGTSDITLQSPNPKPNTRRRRRRGLVVPGEERRAGSTAGNAGAPATSPSPIGPLGNYNGGNNRAVLQRECVFFHSYQFSSC